MAPRTLASTWKHFERLDRKYRKAPPATRQDAIDAVDELCEKTNHSRIVDALASLFVRNYQGLEDVDSFEFLKLAREKMAMLGMDQKFLNRGVNEGFSGGEKKRNEILQMAMLEPELAILDETDSGLDIDALKAVAQGVNALRSPDRAIVLVTHYQRLLDYVEPDFVHVLSNGRIIRSGDKTLALELEEKGYDWVREAANA